jgi:hypothetical protein
MCGFNHIKKGRTNREVCSGDPNPVEAPKMTPIQSNNGSQCVMKRRDIRAKEQRRLFKSNRKNNCQAVGFLAIKGTLYANSQRLFQMVLPLYGRADAALPLPRGQ